MPSPILPTVELGKPFPFRRTQLSPPSRLVQSPLSGPPLSLPQGHICICQVAAKRIRGLDGCITISMPPEFSPEKRTLSQVTPPFLVRKMPRSSCGPYKCPAAAAKTISGSSGCITILPILPVSSRPM